MKLRFGIGKRVGPFYVGATFGKKSKPARRRRPSKQRITYTIKFPDAQKAAKNTAPKKRWLDRKPTTQSAAPSTAPKKRWRDNCVFWFVLAALFVVAFPTGLVNSATDGFSGAEIATAIIIIGLAVYFFFIGWKKRGFTKTSTAEPLEPEASMHYTPSASSTVADPFDEIDHMDGHQFEHWCADLLHKNRFTDVEVTKGSGDQGVDVLASRDGVKYAVQCKCYSSPLGNTPVQEVNTGKTIYHCQIGAVMTNQSFTPGARAAAEATGVLLWGRDHLIELMEHAQ